MKYTKNFKKKKKIFFFFFASSFSVTKHLEAQTRNAMTSKFVMCDDGMYNCT